MKIYRETKPVLAAPVFKPFKPELFFDRVKEFEDAMMRRRFYELFTPFTGSRELEGPFENEYEYLHVPIELRETEDGFVIYAEIPGFKEKEIEVRVEPWRVFLTGKREEITEQRKGKMVYSERAYNQISRWFELPAEIDPEKVKATLTKGVLEIVLQRAQVAKKVPIEVKAA